MWPFLTFHRSSWRVQAGVEKRATQPRLAVSSNPIIIHLACFVNDHFPETAMPTLRQCLESLPHRDVRGIATRLGLRQRSEHRKDLWIDAIVAAWQDPELAARFVAALSPAALSTARRLAQAGEVPAALFLADPAHGGGIRRPRRGQHWIPPPWEAPHSIAEELYYCGLLAPIPATLVEKAARLGLPADLWSLFRREPALPAPATDTPIAGHDTADDAQTAPMAPSRSPGPASDLLHDVAQVLCFLMDLAAADRTPLLLHDRWLAPAALAQLNQRLLRPERASALRSHRQAPQLRFLFFLTAAAGLQVAGALTPRGWAWLAEPPAARFASLWHAWRTAPLTLCQAYRQPSAALPPPWPDLALKHLTDLPPGFTAAALAQRVLGQETAYTAYFTAHLPDIGALDAAAAGLLETLAGDWGALTRTAPPTDSPALPPAYALTPLGCWLVDGAAVELVGADAVPASIELAANAEVHPSAVGGWRLTVSTEVTPVWLADLAVYARHEESGSRRHRPFTHLPFRPFTPPPPPYLLSRRHCPIPVPVCTPTPLKSAKSARIFRAARAYRSASRAR